MPQVSEPVLFARLRDHLFLGINTDLTLENQSLAFAIAYQTSHRQAPPAAIVLRRHDRQSQPTRRVDG
jgi:hypothetical protein